MWAIFTAPKKPLIQSRYTHISECFLLARLRRRIKAIMYGDLNTLDLDLDLAEDRTRTSSEFHVNIKWDYEELKSGVLRIHFGRNRCSRHSFIPSISIDRSLVTGFNPSRSIAPCATPMSVHLISQCTLNAIQFDQKANSYLVSLIFTSSWVKFLIIQ